VKQQDFELIISAEQSHNRLDHFLSQQKQLGLTRSQVQRLIDDGFIEVNNEVPKASYKIKANDRVAVTIPAPKELKVKPEKIPLEIIYEDSDLIVVNKPRGMVMHPAAGNYTGTLVNALLYHCKDLSGIGGVLRPGIVHRLDKDTSGVVVVAKNDMTHQLLAKQFKNRKIAKQYLALVHGVIKQDEGTIEKMIGRHPKHRKKMAVMEGTRGPFDRAQGKLGTKGREAITLYEVKERFKNYTLLELILKTGRTHQIRVHLTSIGHAIVGDPTYGTHKNDFEVKGQLLHAAKIGFFHPRNNEWLEFYANMPKVMDGVIKKLRGK